MCASLGWWPEGITTSIHHKNIYGVQFHPEKSHKYGMKLLNNFAKLRV
ncbi:MAG: hypothetical protein HFG62_05775 [Lachnospiraceae bacterium]|nr:hypothetical protein [Lachnospiraceae bacterium]